MTDQDIINSPAMDKLIKEITVAHKKSTRVFYYKLIVAITVLVVAMFYFGT